MKVKALLLKLAIVSSVMITFLTIIPHYAFPIGAVGGNLDLFTQKTPFDGKGPNQSSDAFEQQELVVLYALVTFSGDPIADKVVAFQVSGPTNTIENITVTAAAVTNGSGIAVFSFRMPTAPINGEQMVFGVWNATATVDIDQTVAKDNLTFEVGWIIRIKSIATLDEQLTPQTDFIRGSKIVFDLTLENIALTPKNATITIDAQDFERHPIIHAELDNQNIQPGEHHLQVSSQIPIDAKIGQANVSAGTYKGSPTSGGTSYSPPIYTTFNVVIAKGIDVAITDVEVSASQLHAGESVAILVKAANLGNFSETFDITVYYDSNLIQLIPAISLSAHLSKAITVIWNTANLNPGIYTISANATIVEGDMNPANNKFTDGNIIIIPGQAPLVPYWVLLILLLMGVGILSGLASLILLVYYSRRRKRRTRGSPRYVTIVHPHI